MPFQHYMLQQLLMNESHIFKIIFIVRPVIITKRYWILSYVVATYNLVFHPFSCFFTPNTDVYTPMYPSSLPNYHLYFSNPLQWILTILSCPVCPSEGWRKTRGRVVIKWWVSVCLCNVILAQNIYCAKPNPDPDAHSSYRVRKVIVDQYPRSTMEYDIMNEISIQKFTQHVTCEMDLSSFVAMIQLKVVSTTSASR